MALFGTRIQETFFKSNAESTHKLGKGHGSKHHKNKISSINTRGRVIVSVVALILAVVLLLASNNTNLYYFATGLVGTVIGYWLK